MFSKIISHLAVTHMSVRTGYTGFQMLRIRSHLQHGFIIVCFENQIIGALNICSSSVRNMSDIGYERKGLIPHADAISYVVRCIVRHFETSNAEIFYLDSFFLVDKTPVGIIQFSVMQ